MAPDPVRSACSPGSGWRTWAAGALAYAGEGAALSHRSAGFVHGVLSAAPTMIEVSVEHRRRVDPQARLRVYRRRRMPPSRGRLRATGLADTVLDVIDVADLSDDVVGRVCAGVRAGAWPGEILARLASRPRMRHRALVLEVLSEVAHGIESPLERRYARDVEARHRLPRAVLQVRQRLDGRWIRADAVYEDLGTRVELDGALAHPAGRTDHDTWRDNAVLITNAETQRYRWSHVAGQPCAVARQVGLALRAGGWRGDLRPCGPRCAAAEG